MVIVQNKTMVIVQNKKMVIVQNKKMLDHSSTSFLSPHLTVQLGEVKEKREKTKEVVARVNLFSFPPAYEVGSPSLSFFQLIYIL